MSTFIPKDVPVDGRFNMGTFWHKEFSTREIFSTMDISARDILAPEHFGTWIFWHLAKHYGLSAQTFRYLCYCAEMSPCRNVLVPKIPRVENSSCRKVPMSERSRVETSIFQIDRSAERCRYRNVTAMKHLCRNDSCRNLRCRNGGK